MKKLLMTTAVASVLLASCGGGAGGQASLPGASTVPTTAISGNVVAGPVNGATIQVFAMLPTGKAGKFLAGPFKTKIDGSWVGKIPTSAKGPFIIIASGGSYTDEFTGAKTTSTTIESTTTDLTAPVPTTPLTQAFFDRTKEHIAAGASPTNALALSRQAFIASLGFDPSTEVPTNPMAPSAKASTKQSQYAAILGGLSTILDRQNPAFTALANVKTGVLVAALAKDMVDMKLDGMANGKAISVLPVGGTTPIALPALDSTGMAALKTAIAKFQLKNNKGLSKPTLLGIPTAAISTIGTAKFGTLTIAGVTGGNLPQRLFVPTLARLSPVSANSQSSIYTFSTGLVNISVNINYTTNIISLSVTNMKSMRYWTVMYKKIPTQTIVAALGQMGIVIDDVKRTVTFTKSTLKPSAFPLPPAGVKFKNLVLNGTVQF